jgi:hypothetical protein
MDAAGNAWLDDELSGCSLADERLTKRLRKLLEQMEGAVGASIPLACQDWANTKAAYRFFSNDRIDESEILAGHFKATRSRFDASEGPVLVLQDTTELTYQRETPDLIGVTKSINSGKDKAGRLRKHTVCGLLMHSSLAVTLDGLPLGLAAVKFWTRANFKGTAALKRKINPTRVPIEQKESFRWLENLRQSDSLLADPDRCVHVGDRESDIYELFCLADDLGTHFLVRTCVDRLAGEGDHTIAAEMNDVEPCGIHTVEVRHGKDAVETVEVELKYHRLRVLPPIGKQKHYRALTLTVLHAKERQESVGRPKIDWKLITDLPVSCHAEAVEKLGWYALRWKIEVFHKILKSGCKAEDVKLRTAERLTRLLCVFCIVAWRVFWMTMVRRSAPDAEPGIALTPVEMQILDRMVPNQAADRATRPTLSTYLTKLARLGGYLARGKDPPPGNTVMWRGMTRLADIKLGVEIAGANCVGN